MYKLLPLVLVGAITLACESEDETPMEPPADTEVELTGSWSGRAGTDTFAMLLSQSASDALVGAGSIQRNTGSQGFEVSGLVVGADVSLVLRTQTGGLGDEEALINFQGLVASSGDRMDGVLNGGGFDDISLSLTRQRGS